MYCIDKELVDYLVDNYRVREESFKGWNHYIRIDFSNFDNTGKLVTTNQYIDIENGMEETIVLTVIHALLKRGCKYEEIVKDYFSIKHKRCLVNFKSKLFKQVSISLHSQEQEASNHYKLNLG